MKSVATLSIFDTLPWYIVLIQYNTQNPVFLNLFPVYPASIHNRFVCLCRKAVMRRMSTCCRPSCTWGVMTWIKLRPVCSVETAETATCAKPSPVPLSAMLMDSTDEPLTNTPQTALTEHSSQGPWTLTSVWDTVKMAVYDWDGLPLWKRRDTWT